MQNPGIAQLFAYIERTSRPDVWEKRKMLARPLIEAKYSSVSQLVRSIDGNTRDAAWISQALKDGIIERDAQGPLVLSDGEPETIFDRVLGAIWDDNEGDDEMSQALANAARAAYNKVRDQRIARGEEP